MHRLIIGELNMAELSMDNILSESDIDLLFSEEEPTEKQDPSPESEGQEKEKKETTEELNVEGLFEETSESVGSEERQGVEDTTSEKKTGSSPTNNFYSSIAKALKEDGVFPDLDDETADNIKEAEDFAEVLEQQIQARLDEKQKRIDEALNAGVEDATIRQYENTIAYLNGITDELLNAENEQGENLRKQLIYQDLINKEYSKEEAQEELKEIFESGSDIRKAKRALAANKEFFRKNYQKIIDEAKEEKENEERERREQTAALKKAILEDKKVFGEIQLDKATRQKVLDNISKPTYRDKETGELFTALQKYEMDNKVDFIKNVGLLFTLTDGFKNLDKLVQGKVKSEVKKGLRELEHTLNNTSRSSDGNLKFVSGVSDDPESFIGKWDLDV